MKVYVVTYKNLDGFEIIGVYKNEESAIAEMNKKLYREIDEFDLED